MISPTPTTMPTSRYSTSESGLYDLFNYTKPRKPTGYIQSCTSESCCLVLTDRKYFSKKLNMFTTHKIKSHFKSSILVLKTKERSKLKTHCDKCCSALFTEVTYD